MKPIILIIGIGLLGGLILASQAKAQEPAIGLSISPLTFELTANPGDTISNKLKVYNPTESIISVKMETEDFRPIGETGKVKVAPEEEMTYSLKRWVRTEPTEFTLESKEQKFVDFLIEVPESAEPGGKYGSILGVVTGTIGEETTGAAIAQKVGALLLLVVSGDVHEKLQIKEFVSGEIKEGNKEEMFIPKNLFEYGPISFEIKFENTGTVHVRPRGFVTITNWRDKKIKDIEFPQFNVIPGAVRKINTTWDCKWLFGRYTATLVGSYGIANTPLDPQVINFWIIPWKIILSVFLLILLILIFLFLTRRRWKLALEILFKGEQKI